MRKGVDGAAERPAHQVGRRARDRRRVERHLRDPRTSRPTNRADGGDRAAVVHLRRRSVPARARALQPVPSRPGAHGLEILGAGGGRNRHVYLGRRRGHAARARAHVPLPAHRGAVAGATSARCARRSTRGPRAGPPGTTLRHARGPASVITDQRRGRARRRTRSTSPRRRSTWRARRREARADRPQLARGEIAVDHVMRAFLNELVAEGWSTRAGKYLALSTRRARDETRRRAPDADAQGRRRRLDTARAAAGRANAHPWTTGRDQVPPGVRARAPRACAPGAPGATTNCIYWQIFVWS